MFDESNLHRLIERESGRRKIALRKLVRESLLAAADNAFAIRADCGLAPQWRDKLRRLASIVETQDEPLWWREPPWSNLKLLFCKEAEYMAWLDEALESALPARRHANSSSQSARKIDAVREAVKTLWPKGIPTGLSAKDRDKKINDWLNDAGRSKVGTRTIQRALK